MNSSFYSFYADFGPLNLAMLYRYCCKLNKKLKVSCPDFNLILVDKKKRVDEDRAVDRLIYKFWLSAGVKIS